MAPGAKNIAKNGPWGLKMAPGAKNMFSLAKKIQLKKTMKALIKITQPIKY